MNFETLSGFDTYPQSAVEYAGVNYSLARRQADRTRYLIVLGHEEATAAFSGAPYRNVLLCPLTPANAAALRDKLPWLNPTPLGLHTSAGFGDRLGVATPGHVKAAERYPDIAPIFAQQSVRENARTGRSPQQVLDDAMWGLFQMGWRAPWGADADHLKTPDDADAFIDAGYTFFTIDPGAHVDNEAHTAPTDVVHAKFTALPWEALDDTPEALVNRYCRQTFAVGDFTLALERDTLERAAAKYGCAIAHTARMYRHIVGRMGDRPFDLEVSVDETDTPTSPEEHLFIALELRRLGVQWVSLAPRFVGRFEKGVDYIGDLSALTEALARHAAIARNLGPYKLSLHSGSDKFSVYPIAARLTGGLVHLKTAGTSYLEALRTVAQVAPAFFREILTFAIGRYETDRATYHVSARLANVPAPEALTDAELPDLLNQFDARQILHVTFGSVLDTYRAQLMALLDEHAADYEALLDRHFQRHLASFNVGTFQRSNV
ncbi:MAG TPA: tagaturonate epimerase family protein [Anaerolineae bacterium]|nr:tagaturonate epimerase family protein [Anaerolineae bacterium]HQK14614.1 tagaturonate epimerase family protein [Anaerolineae bacterium]